AETLVALKRPDDAKRALAQGADIFANAPFVKQQFTAAANTLGLTGNSQPLGSPSQADMQAAQEMTTQDRQAMIVGMVDGLAEKLKDNPDHLEGWIRLIRSYSVLGRSDDAQRAYATAIRTFQGRTPELTQIIETAKSSGLRIN
ncbi:MAG: hypothetical protein V7761_12415, partial [Amylibacter sp.]